MTEHLFPDNTVLCNFAAVDRLDLLKSVLGGRGRWTEAVAYEASRSAAKLPPLLAAARRRAGWTSRSRSPTRQTCGRSTRIRRAVFGGTDDEPLKHLGEAQTCYVIKNWASFAGSWWISDDRDAIRYAKFQDITTRETIDILSIAVADGDIGAAEAFGLMNQMADPRPAPAAPEVRRGPPALTETFVPPRR